jgi:hypothetical protein
MPGEQQSHVPFNEQAALEELDRLQRAVEESRQKRKDASAAFDRFVASFHGEPGREGRPQPAAWPRSEIGPSSIARESRLPPPMLPLRASKRVPTTGIVTGAALVLAAGVLVTWIWRSDDPESPPPSSASAAAPAAAPVAAPTPKASEPPLSVGTSSELLALRHVWVRLTVDGKRVLERELDAGARVPLNGQTIVIRAGDAGAVRIIIDGRDRGLMGETGIAVTRSYTSSLNR